MRGCWSYWPASDSLSDGRGWLRQFNSEEGRWEGGTWSGGDASRGMWVGDTVLAGKVRDGNPLRSNAASTGCGSWVTWAADDDALNPWGSSWPRRPPREAHHRQTVTA